MRVVQAALILAFLLAGTPAFAVTYDASCTARNTNDCSINIDGSGNEVLVLFAAQEVTGYGAVNYYSATVDGQSMTYMGAADGVNGHIEAFCRVVTDLSGTVAANVSGWVAGATAPNPFGAMLFSGVQSCTSFDLQVASDELQTNSVAVSMNVEQDGVLVLGMIESNDGTITWSGSNVQSSSVINVGNNDGSLTGSYSLETATQTGTTYTATSTDFRYKHIIGLSLTPYSAGGGLTWQDSTVDIGTTIQGTLDPAFTGAATKCVLASGDEIVATSGTTVAISCDTSKADFISGGALSNTRLAVSENATVQNASETSATAALTLNDPSNSTTEFFGTSLCTQGSDCDADSIFEDDEFPSAFTLGDDIWLTINSGDCTFTPTYGVFECSSNFVTGEFRWYDVSLTDWSEQYTFNIESIPEEELTISTTTYRARGRGPIRNTIRPAVRGSTQ